MRGILAVIITFLATSGIIYADVLLLQSTMGEASLVQIAQVLMIGVAGAFFAAGAWSYPAQRGYLVLIATLFSCMFIRENDGVLDMITHGFWFWPACATALAGGLLFFLNRTTVAGPFRAHADTGPFWIVLVGFFQLILFSRLFGSGQLWDHVPGGAHPDVIKSVVQEGSELVCYALILLGSYQSLKNRFGAARRHAPDGS
ncbi:hypothetical protein [uncultured Roseobacter sp.]|uniref:hypothetical protein n=1 Tax=uncultured Roseobacter sp. TaxID=114847 RepID=UPI0026138012|nr:hypothetical protein [uncultured Roseobacter sp.]